MRTVVLPCTVLCIRGVSPVRRGGAGEGLPKEERRGAVVPWFPINVAPVVVIISLPGTTNSHSKSLSATSRYTVRPH
jgi:hypothetical protein